MSLRTPHEQRTCGTHIPCEHQLLCSTTSLVERSSVRWLQKVVLAREIGSDPKVLIANQPTRGLDVGVIEYVHTQFLKLRDEGVGILLFSEDLDEILTLSDRIAVIFHGEILGIFEAAEADIDTIGLLMAGVKEGT